MEEKHFEPDINLYPSDEEDSRNVFGLILLSILLYIENS